MVQVLGKGEDVFLPWKIRRQISRCIRIQQVEIYFLIPFLKKSPCFLSLSHPPLPTNDDIGVNLFLGGNEDTRTQYNTCNENMVLDYLPLNIEY